MSTTLRNKIFISICLSALLAGCSFQKSVLLPAPSALPLVSRPMKTAGFWISRHPFPDKVILTSEQIQTLNTRIENELHLNTHVHTLPDILPKAELIKELEDLYKGLADQRLYLTDGQSAPKKFFKDVKFLMNLDDIKDEMPVGFGFIVHYADQRLLPTDQILTAKPGDLDFDELQNSALDVGTPVAVLHESRDGRWLYTRSLSSSGWIRKDLIALCSREDIQNWERQQDFVITLEPKTDIFLDGAMVQHYDYAQMGTRFPMSGMTDDAAWILFPARGGDGNLEMKKGYVPHLSVHRGYLEYTPRHVYEQAFKLLNAPYGWGGMYGEQDCSRFLQAIFGTVGINLPRNSSAQGRIRSPVNEFSLDEKTENKFEILRERAVAGITLLYLKGHIVLYLGTVEGEPYAIHAAWAFRENEGKKENVYVMNKVVVSSLRLGEHSKKGSLLSRLKAMVVLGETQEPEVSP